MVDGDDRALFFLQIHKLVHDDALRRLVNARKRLVHDVELRVLCECACDEDALLLSARQLRDLTVGEVCHLHLVECLHRKRAILLAGAVNEPQMGIASHEHNIEDRCWEVPVHRAALRHIGDLFVHGRERLSPEQHRTRDGLKEPEDPLQQGGLARAVRPCDRTAHALRHVEVDVPEHGGIAVCHCEIFDMYDAVRSFHSASLPAMFISGAKQSDRCCCGTS